MKTNEKQIQKKSLKCRHTELQVLEELLSKCNSKKKKAFFFLLYKMKLTLSIWLPLNTVSPEVYSSLANQVQALCSNQLARRLHKHTC